MAKPTPMAHAWLLLPVILVGLGVPMDTATEVVPLREEVDETIGDTIVPGQEPATAQPTPSSDTPTTMGTPTHDVPTTDDADRITLKGEDGWPTMDPSFGLALTPGATAGIAITGLLAIVIFASAIRIVKEYERGVIFRLGRLVGAKGPGLFFIIPIIDKMVKIDLRTITHDVPAQEIISFDNVPVKVNAVVYFKVIDPARAVVEVEHYGIATSQIAQTTLRAVIGKASLDELLAEREKLNKELQQIIDKATDPWGVKVGMVEIKDVELPQDMRRAMARQAEAERERRARVITAEGEKQAAEQLAAAAKEMAESEGGMFLRMLQSLQDVGDQKGSTVVIPLPVEMLRALGFKKE